MSAELIGAMSAVASIVTAVVITATAVAALVQLRHMRAANTIHAMMALRSMIDDPGHRDALDLLDSEHRAIMSTPAFREYARRALDRDAPADADPVIREVFRASLLVANMYETIGAMVKFGSIPRKEVLSQYCYVYDITWRQLEPFIWLSREAANNESIYEDFEYLTVLSREFFQSNPSTYPEGAAHIPRPAL